MANTLPTGKKFWLNKHIPRVSIRDVKSASAWFKSKADHEMSGIAKKERRVGGPRKQVVLPQPGSMYMWGYWAKWDATLPTWDKFPMGFIFKRKGIHFWGLNFHYLPPEKRYQLGAALMKQYVEAKGNSRDYLKLSWPLIQAVAKSKLYEPCVKQYLFGQMQTPFSVIEPDEWAMAVQLPIARWRHGKPY